MFIPEGRLDQEGEWRVTRTRQEAANDHSATESPGQARLLRSSSVKAWISGEEQTRWVTVVSLGGLAVGALLVLAGGTPWDTPMPTHSFGWVEPTCGLTRGSTALLRGDVSLAWRYNPASFLVIGGALAWLVRSAIGLVTGRWLNLRIRPTALMWVGVGAGLVALWIVQQSNAEFIITSRL